MTKKSFRIKSHLAEALDETVASARNNAGELHIEIIPLKKIELDPDNPRDLALSLNDLREGITENDALSERKNNEKRSLYSLEKSIKEQGIINPIVVYKHNEQYKLIAGERRTFASILAGKTDIPAKILTSRPDQLKLSLIQWIENVERKDLSLWERIRNLEKIVSAYAHDKKKQSTEITPTELSEIIGCALQQGINYHHAMNAPQELRKHIQTGEIKNIDKVAFISKSPIEIQASLIQAHLNGATLSELKKLAKESFITPIKQGKGRPVVKINFGATTNKNVAKTIINTILEHKDFQHFKSELGEIRWDDRQSIALAFKQLLKLLERA